MRRQVEQVPRLLAQHVAHLLIALGEQGDAATVKLWVRRHLDQLLLEVGDRRQLLLLGLLVGHQHDVRAVLYPRVAVLRRHLLEQHVVEIATQH